MRVLIYILTFFFSGFLLANSDSNEVIIITGNISNADSNQPVEAKLSYMTLPHGNAYGLANSNQSDGSYKIRIQKGKTYQLEITCQGYKPVRKIFNSNDRETLISLSQIHMIPLYTERRINLGDLTFEKGTAEMHEEGKEIIEELYLMLNQYPDMKIQLEGHTDYAGSEINNQRLAEERNDAVKNYLISKGISKWRIRTKAYGGSQPLIKGGAPEERTANRRVEVLIVKM